MRSAIEVVGVAELWGFDTRPRVCSLPNRCERYRPVVPQQTLARIILGLCAVLCLCCSARNITASSLLSNSVLLHKHHTHPSSRPHVLHIRTHGNTRSPAVALASSNFSHSVTAQGFSSRPSAGSLRFLPRPSGWKIPFLLSLRDSISPLGVSVSPAQNDHSSRRAARADLRISPRPVEATRHQPSTRVIAIIQRDQWQEEL